MSIDKTWQTVSTSYDATVKLGEQLGQRLKGGEVIELVSDLGGGKTAFVHGLAAGLGSRDAVASPTFTISREYRADTPHGQRTLYHFDFYRLAEPGIVEAELAEVVGDQTAVIAVEWGDIVHDVLPVERLIITIERLAEAENNRRFTFSCPSTFAYLIKGIEKE